MAYVAARASPAGGPPYDVVVLVGHSIGAYMAVELMARHLARRPEHAPPRPNLRHGLLLFPTLASLGLSRAGRRARLLRRLPGLAACAACSSPSPPSGP